MTMPFQKFLCPECGKLALAKWPAAGEKPARDVCSNPGCGYKKSHKDLDTVDF